MQVHAILFVLVAVGAKLVLSDIEPRHLLNFYEMITATTGRGPLLYANYGNWCGIGGKGEPVDEVDSCCRDHDHCYERIAANECKGLMGFWAYFVKYTFNVTDGHIFCTTEKDSACGKVLCECDRTGAICFGKSEYHPEHNHMG